jgi:hypothetical protein
LGCYPNTSKAAQTFSDLAILQSNQHFYCLQLLA